VAHKPYIGIRSRLRGGFCDQPNSAAAVLFLFPPLLIVGRRRRPQSRRVRPRTQIESEPRRVRPRRRRGSRGITACNSRSPESRTLHTSISGASKKTYVSSNKTLRAIVSSNKKEGHFSSDLIYIHPPALFFKVFCHS
jgi:hypothetical protein